MIRLSNLSVFFGKKTLFTDVSLNLSDGNRYGVTGANGSGKSTLLKILAGEASPQDGEVGIPAACKVGFLKQNHFDYEEERIIDTVLMGKPALWKALEEKHAILDKAEHTIDEGMKLAELECDIADEDGYEA
ncbi:MAG: ATP-binding cassette domain-containing protein, partial [bacterium]|nr:ATP-binding cassette domain-containing protein [bacterium]